MNAPTDTPPQSEQPSEEEGLDVLAVISLAFMPDGSVRVQSAGVKANQLWGAAGLLTQMGNDLFDAAKAEQAAARAAAEGKGRLVGLDGGRIG